MLVKKLVVLTPTTWCCYQQNKTIPQKHNELEILLKTTIAEINDYCELKMNVM